MSVPTIAYRPLPAVMPAVMSKLNEDVLARVAMYAGPGAYRQLCRATGRRPHLHPLVAATWFEKGFTPRELCETLVRTKEDIRTLLRFPWREVAPSTSPTLAQIVGDDDDLAKEVIDSFLPNAKNLYNAAWGLATFIKELRPARAVLGVHLLERLPTESRATLRACLTILRDWDGPVPDELFTLALGRVEAMMTTDHQDYASSILNSTVASNKQHAAEILRVMETCPNTDHHQTSLAHRLKTKREMNEAIIFLQVAQEMGHSNFIRKLLSGRPSCIIAAHKEGFRIPDMRTFASTITSLCHFGRDTEVAEAMALYPAFIKAMYADDGLFTEFCASGGDARLRHTSPLMVVFLHALGDDFENARMFALGLCTNALAPWAPRLLEDSLDAHGRTTLTSTQLISVMKAGAKVTINMLTPRLLRAAKLLPTALRKEDYTLVRDLVKAGATLKRLHLPDMVFAQRPDIARLLVNHVIATKGKLGVAEFARYIHHSDDPHTAAAQVLRSEVQFDVVYKTKHNTADLLEQPHGNVIIEAALVMLLQKLKWADGMDEVVLGGVVRSGSHNICAIVATVMGMTPTSAAMMFASAKGAAHADTHDCDAVKTRMRKISEEIEAIKAVPTLGKRRRDDTTPPTRHHRRRLADREGEESDGGGGGDGGGKGGGGA